MSKQILLSRTRSSPVSTWQEFLTVERLPDGVWQVATCAHNWLSLEAIPEEHRYDENDEPIVPETVDGHRVLGIVDGEFLETDELVVRGATAHFLPGEWNTPAQYCLDALWTDEADFGKAWLLLKQLVKQG